MSDAHPVKRVVIVGRDEALWLTANVLQRALRASGLTFTVVELPSLLRPGEVFPTLGNQAAFHSLLGLDEAILMDGLGATFTLGQRFVGWAAKSKPPFMLGYSSVGVPLERTAFHHHWVRARASGLTAAYEDFAINAVAAKNGRFVTSGSDLQGFAQSEYGYHLPALPYVEVLRDIALKRGVVHVKAHHISPDGTGEQMRAVVLSDGARVEGDLFIDATGAEARLLSQMPGTDFDSWRHWFPCDRLLTAYAAPMSPLPAYAQITAFRSGWLGLFPVRDYTALQQVYLSSDLSDDEAFEMAGMVASLPFNPQATVTPFEAGRRAQAWSGNVIALGDAAAVFDPLDSARMPALLTGLSHLISLFPLDTGCIEAAVYNRVVTQAYERLRDFQCLHYKLNQRRDQPLWDQLRGTEAPETLDHKLRLFAARGHMPMYDDEAFDESLWIAACIGHGLIPEVYDPMADQVPEPEVIAHFQKALGYLRQQVEALPPMEAVLKRQMQRA